MFQFLKYLLWDNPFQPFFLKGLLIINFLGSLYGYYWYYDQLLATPWPWWIFTPDSPLSTSLFTLTLALLLSGKGASVKSYEGVRGREASAPGRNSWNPETFAFGSYLGGKVKGVLGLLACAALIKYGLWAVVVIGDYWIKGASVTWIEALLFLSHLGMAAQGYLFLRHWPFYLYQGFLVGIWLMLNDYVDYILGWHPYLFRGDQVPLAAATAIVLSVFWFLYCLGRKMSRNTEY